MANIKKAERNDIIMPENRDFKGVWIPKKLYISREVTLSEKFLLIEIYTLSKKHICYASNKHFADFTGLKENTVQKAFLGFEEKGYVERHYEYKNNTKEIKCRKLILTQKFYDDFINETDAVDFNPQGDGLKLGDKYNNNKDIKHYSATSSHECDILIKAKSITDDSTVINAIEYYLSKYEVEMVVKHPDVTYSAMSRVIENICCGLQDVWEDIKADDGLSRMIDRHFDTNYGQPIDYKIQHFGTEGVLLYQARNCGYIDGYKE